MAESKIDINVTADIDAFLVAENSALRRAGCEMAEAALYVAREYDGVHRLMLAVSNWSKTLADEGGRGKRHGNQGESV
jgi:hypothetical protein